MDCGLWTGAGALGVPTPAEPLSPCRAALLVTWLLPPILLLI